MSVASPVLCVGSSPFLASAAGPLRRVVALCGVLAGLLLPALGLFGGCDSSQFVIVNVSGLPDGGNFTLSAYYSLGSPPGTAGAAPVTSPVTEFGIKIPDDARGKFTVMVFAYDQPGSCYSYSGQQSLTLDGSYRANMAVTVAPASPKVCDFSQIPVPLPPTTASPLVTWGDAPTNIWMAGENGVILRWDGSVLSRIPLPPDLAAAPPTWLSIGGAGPGLVWFGGNKGVIARWDGTQLQSVGLVVTQDLLSLAADAQATPDWVSIAVVNPAVNEVLFASSTNYVGRYNMKFAGVQFGSLKTLYYLDPMPVYTGPASQAIHLASVHCLSAQECWFAGNNSPMGAFIMQAYYYSTQTAEGYAYTDYSTDRQTHNALTPSPLLGIWGTVTGDERDIIAVGADGTVLLSDNSVLGSMQMSTYYPVFGPPCASCMPPTVNLNAVAGTALSDVWITGEMGSLFHYDPKAATPFTTKPLATKVNLTSIFSIGNRVYTGGQQSTLFSAETP